ncbi:MAG TPA: hypothetical protein PKO09_06205 [Anaerolineae bacterium]|nr:hypothetical protein [Anaerolineae bacterium]
MKERRCLLRLLRLVAPGFLLPGFLRLWLPISGAGVAVALLALAGSGPSACADSGLRLRGHRRGKLRV